MAMAGNMVMFTLLIQHVILLKLMLIDLPGAIDQSLQSVNRKVNIAGNHFLTRSIPLARLIV